MEKGFFRKSVEAAGLAAVLTFGGHKPPEANFVKSNTPDKVKKMNAVDLNKSRQRIAEIRRGIGLPQAPELKKAEVNKNDKVTKIYNNLKNDKELKDRVLIVPDPGAGRLFAVDALGEDLLDSKGDPMNGPYVEFITQDDDTVLVRRVNQDGDEVINTVKGSNAAQVIKGELLARPPEAKGVTANDDEDDLADFKKANRAGQ